MAIAMPTNHEVSNATLKQMLGQKLMLDLRYFCDAAPEKGQCRTPMTSLPNELFTLLRDYDIGGVILFAENLVDAEQTIKLNRDMQKAAVQSPLGLPLFIGIDQEGGRVTRFPRHIATSFAGNMAIGATYAESGTKYASEVGKALADELLALGINVNFAPTIDVNANPLNPVINVRSFGENPESVAKLGNAMTLAMQKRGMIAALKHFPGHGDTAVDSHLGLPRVDHSLEQIKAVDLYPYTHIIKQQKPGMIMTAHIQFPALDSTTFVSKDGETMIKPATLSRTILTDILRKKMGFEGVIVTDALDMAGISKFFTQTDAVIQTFAAGADIALMPVKIQHPGELQALADLLNALEQAVEKGVINKQELAESFERIVKLKNEYQFTPLKHSEQQQVDKAHKVLGSKVHRDTELSLAKAAITQVKPALGKWPFKLDAAQKLLLVMPDAAKAKALSTMLSHYSKTAFEYDVISLQHTHLNDVSSKIAGADVVISAFISPMQSLADIGGMDDLTGITNIAAAFEKQKKNFETIAPLIKAKNKKHIFISLRTPYDISLYGQYADVVLASYSYNTTEKATEVGSGNAVYEALAMALLNQYTLTGKLPVTVEGYK